LDGQKGRAGGRYSRRCARLHSARRRTMNDHVSNFARPAVCGQVMVRRVGPTSRHALFVVASVGSRLRHAVAAATSRPGAPVARSSHRRPHNPCRRIAASSVNCWRVNCTGAMDVPQSELPLVFCRLSPSISVFTNCRRWDLGQTRFHFPRCSDIRMTCSPDADPSCVV